MNIKNPLLVSAPLLVLANLASGAVSLNYTNDFSTAASEYTPSTPSQWTLPGGGVYQNIVPGNSPSSSLLEVTGLGAGTKQGFQMTTTFTLTDSATSGSVGIAALGTTTSTGTASFYLADISQAGGMRFRPFSNGTAAGADLAVNTTGTAVGTLGTSEVITLTLTGTYNGSGALTLALTAFDGTNTQTITTATPITGPADGNAFGFRNRSNIDADPITVRFDSVSITAIPEPSSMLLLSAGLVGLTFRRRK